MALLLRWAAALKRGSSGGAGAALACGMVALADRSTYGIAKAGIIHMTRMLAIEWAKHNITLNAIAPGTIETPSRALTLKDPKFREMMLGGATRTILATSPLPVLMAH